MRLTVALVAGGCLLPAISASSTGASGSAELFLDLELDSADLPVGADHLLVATVREAGGPAAGVGVTLRFETGPSASADPRGCVTGASGSCAVMVRSGVPGTDLVRAWAGAEPDPLEPVSSIDDDATDAAELRWHQAVLDAGPESAAAPEGAQAGVEVVVRSATDPSVSLHARVDLEVVSGPNDNLRYGEADATCLAAAAPCVFSYTGQRTSGVDVVRAWIDDDLEAAVPGEADGTEDPDEALGPGAVAEADRTDAVERVWTGGVGPAGSGCPGSEEQPGNRIVGTPGDDTIVGTPNGDVICGLGGRDVILGRGGNDAVLAGLGSALVDGGEGFDFVTYHTARGPVRAEASPGTVEGSFGRDSLTGIEAIVGSYFDDVLMGGEGPDSFNGTFGDDHIVGGAGEDVLYDFAGDDVLIGGPGKDLLIAADGDDRLSGGTEDDRLFGGRGADVLRGGHGTDRCASGPGRDRLRRCEGGFAGVGGGDGYRQMSGAAPILADT